MVKFTDYELIDFGGGRKLERFGTEILNRPETMAENKEKKQPKAWANADHVFNEAQNKSGEWTPANNLGWTGTLQVNNKSLSLQLTKGKFKHVGVFPEQLEHWKLLGNVLKSGDKMLNLFAYTGVSSLVGEAAGASVTHIDSSKSILKTARENAERNAISSIRFIQEDALKFSQRELKRKQFYDLVICDPPVFGMGVKREKWKLEKDLPTLIETLKMIIAPGGLLILNTYSPRVSIPDMKELAQKNNFDVQDSGWLEIISSAGDVLRMSKYIVGKRSASA